MIYPRIISPGQYLILTLLLEIFDGVDGIWRAPTGFHALYLVNKRFNALAVPFLYTGCNSKENALDNQLTSLRKVLSTEHIGCLCLNIMWKSGLLLDVKESPSGASLPRSEALYIHFESMETASLEKMHYMVQLQEFIVNSVHFNYQIEFYDLSKTMDCNFERID